MALVSASFLPAKAHIKEQPQTFKRFKAEWTPTQIVMSPEGEEVHRIEGFLPAGDFLAQLELGLAKVDFSAKRFGDSERRFRAIVERYSKAGAAPEALYWAGVSLYRASKDSQALRDTRVALEERYPESEWARKSSVWQG